MAADLSQHLSLLKSLPLFRPLPEQDLSSFIETLQLVELRAGEAVFEEGQAGEHFYVVIRGSLEIIKHRGLPEEELLARRSTGEFIGEMSLLNQQATRMASVIAMEDSQLIEITRAQFDDLLNQHPLTAYEMVRVMSSRLTNAHERSIQILTQKNTELAEAYAALKRAQAQIVEKERLERELELAAEIQRSLLPHQIPALEGYDFCAHLTPARTVGGDLYDFIPLDDQRLGVVIGDITDKGIPAALLMAQAQTLIRSETTLDCTPGQVLHAVNAYLYHHNISDHFITVLYGILHLATGDFLYARAGHEAPWLCLPDGTAAEAPHATGQPLGILEDPILDEQLLNIPPGGLLLLYTDGLVDNLGGRDQSGDLLKSPLSALVDSSTQEVCTSLMQRVQSKRVDQPLVDDVTLIAIGRATA
jgi:serine phosphatase RsbU (regulator of sigma subunit)